MFRRTGGYCKVNKKAISKNIIVSFGGQFVIIVLGLVIPRIFIKSYGSDVNGLLSTITQIFTYMALLEAGIGQAARNALYKPFAQQDRDGINIIVSVAKSYYRKFTSFYGMGVLCLAIGLPFILKTNVNFGTIFWIVIFEGMSGVISFYFIETPSAVLQVDGKSYINNSFNLVNRIIGYFVKIIMAANGYSIIILQFAYFIITIAKVFAYQTYFRKHYSWIEFKKSSGQEKLKDRNSYILTEIAATVFNSTDMIVLSVFLSTQIASVYSIYNMIYSNIHLLLNSVYFSIVYILGNAYHTDIKKYETIHDAFNSIFLGTITVLMSISYLLTIPFVSLYTADVADVEYIYKSLPVMFSLVQILSWSRYVSGNLTGIAGFAKQTSYVSLIEAFTNLFLSIVFVNKFGIVGVLFATVVALPLKVLWCTYIADKKVMHRSFKKSVSIIGANVCFFIIVVIASKFIQAQINTYFKFLVWGIIYSLILGSMGILVNYFANKESWSVIKKYLLKK